MSADRFNLMELHKEFIDAARMPGRLANRLPVNVGDREVPVIPSSRWRVHEGTLIKTFSFRRQEDRRLFVRAFLDHEDNVGHHSVMFINNNNIEIRLTTHDLGKVTELDKEMAAFADVLYKDIVYSSSDNDTAK